jgi:hypothetical protein
VPPLDLVIMDDATNTVYSAFLVEEERTTLRAYSPEARGRRGRERLTTISMALSPR